MATWVIQRSDLSIHVVKSTGKPKDPDYTKVLEGDESWDVDFGSLIDIAGDVPSLNAGRKATFDAQKSTDKSTFETKKSDKKTKSDELKNEDFSNINSVPELRAQVEKILEVLEIK